MLWQQAGKTLDVLVAPFGNKTATPKQPHFKVRAKVGVKPSLSSEAGDEKGATFEFEWACEGEPEKLTATSTLGTGNMEDA